MSQAAVPVQLFGVPADGKKIRWIAYDVYRVTNGKISEEWGRVGNQHAVMGLSPW
jgi:predicted ester cyclase